MEGKKYILFYVATIKKAIRVEMRFYRSLILSENLSLRGQIEETIIKTSYLEKTVGRRTLDYFLYIYFLYIYLKKQEPIQVIHVRD